MGANLRGISDSFSGSCPLLAIVLSRPTIANRFVSLLLMIGLLLPFQVVPVAAGGGTSKGLILRGSLLPKKTPEIAQRLAPVRLASLTPATTSDHRDNRLNLLPRLKYYRKSRDVAYRLQQASRRRPIWGQICAGFPIVFRVVARYWRSSLVDPPLPTALFRYCL